MKKSFIYLFIAVFVASCALRKPIPSPAFAQASRFHERIAILPFSVEFNENYKRSMAMQGGRNVRNEGYWVKTGKFAGMDMQKNTFKNMARRISKGKYELIIQDFLTTNRKLDELGISYQGLPAVNKGLLAKQLDVDAVIYGETMVNIDFRGMNPGGVNSRISVFDARSGEIIWQDELEQQIGSMQDSPERLAARTIDQLIKRLPY
jgi:hypothetical protein